MFADTKYPTEDDKKKATEWAPIIGWAPGTVRAILMREMYRGVVVWNKSRKRDDFAPGEPTAAPGVGVAAAPTPSTCASSTNTLWRRVQSAAAGGRDAGRAVRRRPPVGPTAEDGHAEPAGRAWPRARSAAAGWSSRPARGSAAACRNTSATGTARNGACTNALRIPVAEMNEAVLQAIEEHALTPEAIEQVIHSAERDDVRERQDA